MSINDVKNDVSFLFDTDIASYTTNTIKSIYEQTWFNLVLHGLRISFNRVLQCSTDIEYTFTDRYKELLLKKTRNKLTYPYAFVVINDIDLMKDQINTSTVARHGVPNRNRIHGDSVTTSYLFPFKMNVTLNVLDSDVNSLFGLTQAIFLSDVSRSFNFAIRGFNSESKIKVQRTGNISFSEATINTEQENDYGTGHITCTFEIQGWMGFTTLIPTIKDLVINVFHKDSTNKETSEYVLDFSYKVGLREGQDGKTYINKLYLTPGGED